MAFLWFSRKPKKAPDPLPAVLPPEIITNEKAYLNKVLGESRSVLDADLGGFETLESRNGWSVHRKPVQGTKVGCNSLKGCQLLQKRAELGCCVCTLAALPCRS